MYRVLTLNGYVAFNLPRAVTAAGGLLLVGLVVAHLYVWATATAVPAYFAGYCALLITSCLLAIVAMGAGFNPVLPQRGWQLGTMVGVVFLGLYLASRAASMPGLADLTGSWDLAPGTFAAACAVGFIGLHMSIVLGINVAYPRRRNWYG
ncbi:hypothetical protein MSIMFI_03362 [Mycobacterium simulans]|nr:hypothetical protein MSIMFI_03362 [Mycobacterium simulans]